MFNTKIPVYGIFIIFAILSGIFVVYKTAKILNLKKEELVGLLIYIGLGAIFGAKYFTFVTNFQKFNGLFDFHKIGLSSYGAFIGILILLFLFSKQYKRNLKDLVFVLLPSIPLMYGIGKIGCFLAGCCYGIAYDGPFNIVYNYSSSAPNEIGLFPVQLLESIIFIVIFVYVFYKVKKENFKDIVIAQTFIICGMAKYFLDYLRMSHVGLIISVNQLISILFVLVGVCIIIRKTKSQKD